MRSSLCAVGGRVFDERLERISYLGWMVGNNNYTSNHNETTSTCGLSIPLFLRFKLLRYFVFVSLTKKVEPKLL